MKSIFSILLLLSSLLSFAQTYTWQWANEVASNANESVLGSFTDTTSGETYVCGHFQGDLSSVYTAGLNGTPNMSSPSGTRDAFVAKYNAAGNVIWAFKIGGTVATTEAEAITIGPSGNIYITGRFMGGTIDFKGVTASNSNSRTPTGASNDVFVAAYNANGELQWVNTSIDAGESRGYGITTGPFGVYVAGAFRQNITFPPLSAVSHSGSGHSDGFITKFDFSGAAIRIKLIYSTTNDGDVRAFNVVEHDSDIFAVGVSESTTWTFGPTGFSPNANNNGPAGKNDIWVISMKENNFNLNWEQVIGGSERDRATGIAADDDGVYITGGVGGTAINFPGMAALASTGVRQKIFTCKLLNTVGPTKGETDWVEIEQKNTSTMHSEGRSIALDSDGNLFIAGNFSETTNFNGGLNSEVSAGQEDIFVMNRKVDGSFVWLETAESTGEDKAFGVGYDNTGNVYVGGIYDLASTFGSINLNTSSLNNGFVAKLGVCQLSISCPSNQTVGANASCQSTLLDYTGMALTAASCGFGSVTQIPSPGTVINSGVNEITLILTDLNGNKDSCKMDVIVEASVNPTVVSCGTSLVGETTVGNNDTENSFGCVGFSTPGEDVYYQFTVPAGNYWMQVIIDNVVDANDSWLETFWVGGTCPVGGGCIDHDFFDISTQEFSGGGNSIQYLAVGPGTYYFVVDAINDGIDSYDISFNCLKGGIEFDESVSCGDVNNDGLIAYINDDILLNTETCNADTICHDMFIANQNGFEWIDSVYMDLGSCYTNVVPTNVGGFFQPGNWIGTYLPVSNGIAWQFNHDTSSVFGDGIGGNYSCDLAKTRKTRLCFTTDISATCEADSNLNVGIFISDDGVGSAGSTAASFDRIISDDFIISNPVPTISCVSNVNVNSSFNSCDTVISGIAPVAFNDNCPQPFVTYTLSGATTGSGLNDASGTLFNLGVTTVKYFVSDSLGSKDSCSFTVTVADATNPTIACPSSVTALCPGVVNAIAPLTTGDNCGIDSLSYVLTGATTGSGLNDASGLSFNAGITTVTYTVTDNSGNTATCNFTVTITDAINPTITCPSSVTASCPGIVNAIAPLATADNCGIDSVSYVLTGATTGSGLNDASGLFFNDGITTVTYTVTDSSGNTATCNFTVTVADVINPTITCPANATASCPGVVNAIAPLSRADNCGIDSVSYVLTGATTGSGLNDASGLFFNDGITTVTYTVTDSSGNTASCNFTVTVADVINPTITCPANATASCPGVVNAIAPLSRADNCGIDSVSYVLTGVTTGSGLNDASGLSFNAGITTVTYTVTDSSGNTASCNFTVTVADVINPTITCPANATASCPGVVNAIAPLTRADNCGIDSVSYILTGVTTGSGLNDASGLSFNAGITTVTYTVTDSSGNTASCNFTVTVADVINPTITCPANATASCPGVVNAIAPLTTADNCGIDSVSYVLTGATTGSGLNDASGLSFNDGITTVTYTITDSSGNTASCNFTVTVADVINPVITCPGNVTAPCPGVVNAIALLVQGDDCGVDSVSYVLTGATTGSGLNDASGLSFNDGITTVTYTVTDNSGNTASCNFTVTIADAINPTITCPSSVTAPCPGVVNAIAPLTTGDNCGIDSVSYVLTGATTGSGLNDASGLSFNDGITTVTYTVTDNSGNTATCNFTVTIADAINPTITCPSNVTAPCPGVVMSIAPLTTGDNCGIDSVSYVLTGATLGTGLNDASGLSFNDGITTVTYTVTDNSGNTATCNFTVTIADAINPTITCPANVTAPCPGVVMSIAPLTTGDNCGIDSVSYVLTGATLGTGLNDASGLSFNDGITTVTYTVTDNSGNTATCNFTVTITDVINPTITCQANATASCPGVVTGIAPLTTADNCGIDSVSYVLTGVTTGSGLNDASGLSFNAGITTVTYTVTDNSGNTATCNFTVTITDAINPTITCPSSVTASCPGVVNAIAPLTTADNCGIDSVSYVLTGVTTGSGLNDASGLFFNAGITTVTYTITDNSGNTSSCNFTVTITDVINPTITCPANATAPCPGVVNTIAPLTTGDNCGIDSISYVLTGATTGSGLNDASGLFFNAGLTTVTYTITDNSGNTSSCNFTVTITDAINPTITCPNSVTISCPGVVNAIAPLTTGDNCGIDSISYVLTGATTGSGLNDASGLFFNDGISTITYTITDNSGNTATCNFTVTINDVINPTITCPANVTASCPGVVNAIAPLATADNCGIDSVSYVLTGVTTGSGLNDASGLFFNDGITTVTYMITDNSGNTATCNFTVTINDVINPTITCPANVTLTCPGVVNDIAPATGDNCGIDSVSYVLTGATLASGLNDASGLFFNYGITTVTYSITDNSGNMASCNFTVTVADVINPTITCPVNVTAPCPGIVNAIAPLATADNCGIDSVSYVLTGGTTGSGLNDASGLSFNDGITTVTYTVTDNSGNTATCNFTVTINDTIDPIITCSTDLSVSSDVGNCGALINGLLPLSISDNCGIDSLNYVMTGATNASGLNDASGIIFNIGVTEVKYIVHDVVGNSDSCSFKVTVIDDEKPSIICPSNIIICDTNVLVPLAVVADNCVIESVTNDYNFSNNASGVYPYGITTINWLVTDTSGNTNSCIMTVESQQDPIANAGVDQLLVEEDFTSFDANSFAGGVGNWSIISGYGVISDITNPNSAVEELEQGENIFEWTMSNGTCADAVDEVVITMIPLIIPNGFSPNNDGDNDMFVINGLNLFENEVIIFNRWGIELFNAKNYQNDWDGRGNSGENLPEDTYFYTIQIPELNKDLSGFVVLKR